MIYSLQFVATPDDPMTYYKNAYIGFNVTIPHDRQKAVFDTGSLSWAEQDDKHKPVVKTNPDGSQTLTCYRRLVPTSTSPYTIPGTYTIPFAIDVRAMVEGETLQPEFEAWAVPNDVKNRVAKVTPRPVKVTSYPRFDVSLAQGYNGYAASGGTDAWDFPASGGSGSYPSDEMHTDMGRRNGMLTQFAMSVSMRNPDKGKYMKGLEIPRKGPRSRCPSPSRTISPRPMRPSHGPRRRNCNHTSMRCRAHGKMVISRTRTGRTGTDGSTGTIIPCIPTI